ncbi:hypothetical protein SAMN05421688_0916 [Poseidonocella pacifica]|uniref:Glyceraldehyde-3-phosphate dehydrogenase n=1 Tax=Poseidonocella pacifica TaxID=871651 RepID=A0A1I0VTR9_9RHOB|nr:hypothetical protein [Poseidonocella pacifica]SFA79076.1 hypothetical protein SAMN05421688_0916 [Poseidonocella pacifica]
MTNTLALTLAVLLLGALSLDLWLDGGAGALFLARKGVALIEWLAVWR